MEKGDSNFRVSGSTSHRRQWGRPRRASDHWVLLGALEVKKSRNVLFPSPLRATDSPMIIEHTTTQAKARQRAERGKNAYKVSKKVFSGHFLKTFTLFGLFDLFRSVSCFNVARKR